MNKKVLIAVGIGLGVGLLALALTSKKSSTSVLVTDTLPPTGGGQTTPTTTINLNKILAKGSTGLEVKELQRLMSITADGIFGSQTESRLYQLKGVLKASINQYKSLPTINTTSLPIGTRVMANSGINTETKLYTALQKADGSFYTNNEVSETVNYGNEIGTIKGMDATKNWYLVLRPEFFTDTYYFVKAIDVKKI
jgi:hypothetical protein